MASTGHRGQFATRAVSLLAAAVVLFSITLPVAASTVEPKADLSSEAVAASLSAGLLHSAMINYDGQLYVWGDNTYGQLGLTGDEYIDSPQWLELSDKASQVSLGAYHSLVLLTDGTVWSFGRNAFGQLGIGSTQNAGKPVFVEGLPRIIAIAAGSLHSLALGADGSVWAWGNNTNSQIGNVESETIKGTGGQVLGSRCPKPIQIVTAGAVAIAAGGLHSLYLDDDGQVFAWGDNSKGQLGDGTTLAHAAPAIVPGLAAVTGIAAGYQHSIAVIKEKSGDKLFAWGDDSLGQLGIGSGLTSEAFRTVPVRVDLTNDNNDRNDRVISFAAAYAQTAVTVPAVDKNGFIDPQRQQLLVWGSNANGQLALGQASSQNKPVAVSGSFNGWHGSSFLPFDAIALGGGHMLVLSSKGLLAAAGRGDRGQLGNIAVLDRSQLVSVSIPDVIRPVWAGSSSVSATYTDDGELLIRWPAAQDNRLVTNYRIEIENPAGTVITENTGRNLSWTFSQTSPDQAYKITVMASDADSFLAHENTLSRLVTYIKPLSADPAATVDDYFAKIDDSVPHFNYWPNNWQPDAKNLLRPLEVPWDTRPVYGLDAIEKPADWQSFQWAVGGAIFLIVLMLVDIWRRKFKKVRNVPATTMRTVSLR